MMSRLILATSFSASVTTFYPYHVLPCQYHVTLYHTMSCQVIACCTITYYVIACQYHVLPIFPDADSRFQVYQDLCSTGLSLCNNHHVSPSLLSCVPFSLPQSIQFSFPFSHPQSVQLSVPFSRPPSVQPYVPFSIPLSLQLRKLCKTERKSERNTFIRSVSNNLLAK